MNVVIYEAAMCCSSGVCGPNPDKSLIELQDTLDKVREMGGSVERYSITGSPKKFRENPEVIALMQQRQIKALPITAIDGKVVKAGAYPSLTELKDFLQGGAGNESKEACCSGQGTDSDAGCCAGQTSCDISCGPQYLGTIGIRTKGKCC